MLAAPSLRRAGSALLRAAGRGSRTAAPQRYQRMLPAAAAPIGPSSPPASAAACAAEWTPQQQVRWHGGPTVPADAPTVSVTFVDPPKKSSGNGDDDIGDDGGERHTVQARVGETLLQTAHRHHIEVEGACEGVCACSTCHVILPDELYDELIDLGQEPSEDEEDMLDMAFGLTGTSRLGCQVTVTEGMDGAVVRLPSATRNFYVDGHVPQPH